MATQAGYSGTPLARKRGCVDVKVCAVSAVWSGPEPVIRKERR